MDEFAAANRLNWDDRAELHASDRTGTYSIEKVLSGGSSLHLLETSEIGDLSGKDIVHLQCHIGLDTISLKHLGANSVTVRVPTVLNGTLFWLPEPEASAPHW